MRRRLFSALIIGILSQKAVYADMSSPATWFALSNFASAGAYMLTENKGQALGISLAITASIYAWENLTHKRNYENVSHHQNFWAILGGIIEGGFCGRNIRVWAAKELLKKPEDGNTPADQK